MGAADPGPPEARSKPLPRSTVAATFPQGLPGAPLSMSATHPTREKEKDKAQTKEAPESFRLGRGGRDAGRTEARQMSAGAAAGPAAGRKHAARAVARRRRGGGRGQPGLRREGSGGGVPRRRGRPRPPP